MSAMQGIPNYLLFLLSYQYILYYAKAIKRLTISSISPAETALKNIVFATQ